MRIAFLAFLFLLVGAGQLGAASQKQNPHARFIRDYAASHGFNGVIAVKEDGRSVFRGAFGQADRAFGIPMAMDTRFKIASVTKAFTSVLVLQLAQEGKIALDAPIKTYLPSFPGDGADSITVRNLLNHTSGLPNPDRAITGPDYALTHGMSWYQLPATPGQLIANFYSGKLNAKPGSAFSYNNGDYIVLASILETVSGENFEALLKDRILAPLGMCDTGMLHQRDIVAKLAPSYFTYNKTLLNDLPAYPENWHAAGGLYSTADDLMRFAHALYDGKLIDTSSLTQMLTPGLDHYGYGVWIGHQTLGGKAYRNINRPGSIMGANASFYHFDGEGFAKTVDIVLLSNTDQTNLDKFSFEIGRDLLEKSPKTPR